ncbi:MAG: hypothetical protein AB1814_00570 [Thermodesulfobacteriota bacterium]
MALPKSLLVVVITAAALALSWPALAKPPGGMPPGQAKKMEQGGGPPPWAPAHGYRAKHQYRYWPSNQIYFDPGRGLYFWLSGGGWQVGVRLPAEFTLVGGYVTLHMDADRPYQWHKEVVTQYPPGRVK